MSFHTWYNFCVVPARAEAFQALLTAGAAPGGAPGAGVETPGRRATAGAVCRI